MWFNVMHHMILVIYITRPEAIEKSKGVQTNSVSSLFALLCCLPRGCINVDYHVGQLVARRKVTGASSKIQ
jgi:hypothetical protein